MKVLVTGAAGFVGSALAARIAGDARALGHPVDVLLLADARRPDDADAVDGAAVRWLAGDLADTAYVDALAAQRPDVVFHLASVPGGAAERDPVLGTAVNLHGSVRLIEQLAEAGTPPVFVFTSTVAVYGAPLPAQMDETTATAPLTSYAAHKLMTEYLLADLSRRGRLDARTVRLPGIVARPPQAGGHVSAFMSDVMHRLAAGQPFTCPVSRDATCWWMSVERCVDNLLLAARLPAGPLESLGRGTAARTWTLPVLRASMGELVDALARRFGDDRQALVTWAPQEAVQAQFGRLPPLSTPTARALGFADDGDLDQLIARALPHGG
ncbi:MAG: NAD-dependent epimerase/dehydratase family protein [Burkholderiaceae bacterium]|nr:NAD-dependent epimerase/dehydratase family protein [Burkholderiaceae bacterium]